MKNKKPYEKNFRWLLLLAILINLLFLLFLFFMNFDTNDFFFSKKDPDLVEHDAPVVFDSMPEEPQPEPPQSQEIAALKPRASQFGATEMVQEEPEFSPGVYDQIIPEFVGKDQQDNEQAEEQEETVETEKNIEQKEIKEEKESVKSEHDDVQEVLFKPEIKPIEAKELKKAPPKMQGQQQKASQRTNTGNQAKIASPIEKKLTFNDLASGFLASWQNDGNDWLEREGNENIRPDFEEMRYLSYLQKIAWYMQNAWQRQDRVILQKGPSEIVVTGVRVIIDKNGNLKNALMMKTCGFHELDDMVMNGIREASPYPPLPEHFKKEVMSFDFGVKHWASNSPLNFNFRR